MLLRKRKSPRVCTGSGRVRDRFEAVEIPLKRTKKSQNARRKFFLLPAVIWNKPRKRAVSLFIRYVSHIGGADIFLG